MKVYKTTVDKFTGTEYKEIYPKALSYYKEIKARTKRQPYIRSAFFKKDKVFLSTFWEHLRQKNWRDRIRRLKYFKCAIELIKNSKFEPSSKENVNNSSEILHRFAGVTKENDLFFVQIKEDKSNDKKFLISIFPEEK